MKQVLINMRWKEKKRKENGISWWGKLEKLGNFFDKFNRGKENIEWWCIRKATKERRKAYK